MLVLLVYAVLWQASCWSSPAPFTGHSVFGLADLDETSVGAFLFGEVSEIKEGDECRGTGRVVNVPS